MELEGVDDRTLTFHLSALYERTNDLRLVQDQAGHSSVSITQVYTHVSLNKRQEAVEGLF